MNVREKCRGGFAELLRTSFAGKCRASWDLAFLQWESLVAIFDVIAIFDALEIYSAAAQGWARVSCPLQPRIVTSSRALEGDPFSGPVFDPFR